MADGNASYNPDDLFTPDVEVSETVSVQEPVAPANMDEALETAERQFGHLPPREKAYEVSKFMEPFIGYVSDEEHAAAQSARSAAGVAGPYDEPIAGEELSAYAGLEAIRGRMDQLRQKDVKMTQDIAATFPPRERDAYKRASPEVREQMVEAKRRQIFSEQQMTDPGVALDMEIGVDPYEAAKMAELSRLPTATGGYTRKGREHAARAVSGFEQQTRGLRLSPQQQADLAADKAEAEGALAGMRERFKRTDRTDPETGFLAGEFSDTEWQLQRATDAYDAARAAAVDNFDVDLAGSMDGKNQMLAVLGVIMGGIGVGYAGGTNTASEALERHIERDIKRQYKKQEKIIENLDLSFTQQQLMLNTVKDNNIRAYQEELQRLASITADQKVQADLAGVAADLQMKQASTGVYKSDPGVGFDIWKKKWDEDQGRGKSAGAEDWMKTAMDQEKVIGLIGETENAFNHMVEDSSIWQRVMGRFANEPGTMRNALKATGLITDAVSNYQIKKQASLANIVKILQGSRPSDFDWKKLEILFPVTTDQPRLAKTDFAAIRDISRVTLEAARKATQLVGKNASPSRMRAAFLSTKEGMALKKLGDQMKAAGLEELAEVSNLSAPGEARMNALSNIRSRTQEMGNMIAGAGVVDLAAQLGALGAIEQFED